MCVMAKLISCWSCGGSVSSDLKQCIHCGEFRFRGVLCKMCTKIVPSSEFDTSVGDVHIDCFNKVGIPLVQRQIEKAVFSPINCELCGSQSAFFVHKDIFKYLSPTCLSSANATCKKCGHNFQAKKVFDQINIKFNKCVCCEYPVDIHSTESFSHIVLDKTPKYYHNLCRSNHPSIVSREAEEKEQSERLTKKYERESWLSEINQYIAKALIILIILVLALAILF